MLFMEWKHRHERGSRLQQLPSCNLKSDEYEDHKKMQEESMAATSLYNHRAILWSTLSHWVLWAEFGNNAQKAAVQHSPGSHNHTGLSSSAYTHFGGGESGIWSCCIALTACKLCSKGKAQGPYPLWLSYNHKKEKKLNLPFPSTVPRGRGRLQQIQNSLCLW